jgi:hypothetical protein
VSDAIASSKRDTRPSPRPYSPGSTIVAEAAATKPSEIDMAFCPYPDVPGQETNRRAWQKSEQRRQRERELKRLSVFRN